MEERTSGFRPVKKKKGRFNLVDLLLIVIAVSVIFFVIFVVDPFSLDLFGQKTQEIAVEYTLKISNVEGTLIDKIGIHDEVVDTSTKISLGFVTEVENDIPYSEPYYNAEEDLVSMKEYPDRYNFEVTITASAVYTEGVGYTVNGRRLAVGAQLYLMFPEFLGTGECISLREIG